MSHRQYHSGGGQTQTEEHMHEDGTPARKAVALFGRDVDGVSCTEISAITNAIGNALLTQALDLTLTLALDYDSSDNLVYIGRAAKGSAKSAAAWQIKKLTYNASSSLTDIQWADSDDEFDNIWDNRASLSYG